MPQNNDIKNDLLQLNLDDLSFELAYEKLQEIVEVLENGQYSLDESLGLYEIGQRLVKFCSEALDQVELKVITIDRDTHSENG